MKKITSILLIAVALLGLGGVGAAYYHLEQKRQVQEDLLVEQRDYSELFLVGDSTMSNN